MYGGDTGCSERDVTEASFTPPWAEIPRVGVTSAPRPRVEAALRDAWERAQVVTVTAGAGSGKTTALAAWAHGTAPGSPVAWVNAAAEPVAGGFWRAVRDAVELADPQRTTPTKRAFTHPSGPQWLAGRARRTSGGRLTLVIDDLHEVRSRITLASLDRLLAIMPDELRLVLSSRWDPPLRLERLAAAGRSVDLRGHDLAMTRDEVASVLELRGATLEAPLVERTVELTSGWPVAVGLVATAISQGREPQEVLSSLESADDDVGSYLADEVLGRLPRAWRDLLVRVSAVEQINGPLAVALTGDPTAGATLDEVAARTGLLAPVGRLGGWSELHALARAFLRARLRAEGPEVERDTEARAAAWFAGQRRHAEALSHAVRSRDVGIVRDTTTTVGLDPLLRSDGTEVAEVLHTTDVAAWPPGRGLPLAVAVLAAADPARAARAAELLRWVHPPDPADALLHGVALARVARNAGRLDEARQLLAAVPSAAFGNDERLLLEHERLQVELGTHGAAELERRTVELLAIAETLGADRLVLNLHVALSGYALVRGEPGAARVHAETALTLAQRFGRDATLDRAAASVTGTVAAIELGDLASAEQASRPWLYELTTGMPLQLELAAVTAETHLGARRGDPARTLLARLDRVLPRAATNRLDPAVLFHATSVELRLAEATQDLPRAAGAAGRMATSFPSLAETAVMRADLYRVRHAYAAARRELQPVLDGELAYAMPATELSARCLDIVAATASGTPDRDRLREAVSMGAAARRPGPFIDLGAPMLAALVADGLDGHDPEGFVSGLTAELRRRATPAASEALTAAELRVLERLGSLDTLEEIAAELHLSRNTVKTHVAAVYRKLAVGSRRDAVARARSHGLL